MNIANEIRRVMDLKDADVERLQAELGNCQQVVAKLLETQKEDVAEIERLKKIAEIFNTVAEERSVALCKIDKLHETRLEHIKIIDSLMTQRDSAEIENSELRAEIVRLQADVTEIPTICRRYEAKIERLKSLWYADLDPIETEYAEDYRSRAEVAGKDGQP